MAAGPGGVQRAMRALALIVLLAGVLACHRSKGPPSGTDHKADPWGSPPPNGSPNANDGMATLLGLTAHVEQLAAAEKRGKDAQLDQLDQRITRVEQLIDSGDLDRAEVEASGIQWRPDPTRSQISPSEAALMDEYSQRRDSLLAVIHRKQKPCP